MIQTLDYFLPTDLNRTPYADDGGQLTYYVRDNMIYSVLSNVAWSESAMWTQFQVRKLWLCLIADTGNALPGVRYYTLDPGFWMPLQVEVGWSKHFKANRVEHFDINCESMGVRSGPYTNTLLSHELIDFGGDIGMCDSITLEYHLKDERHTYARNNKHGALGLVRWSKPGFPTGTFNKVRYSPCKMLPVCGRSL